MGRGSYGGGVHDSIVMRWDSYGEGVPSHCDEVGLGVGVAMG